MKVQESTAQLKKGRKAALSHHQWDLSRRKTWKRILFIPFSIVHLGHSFPNVGITRLKEWKGIIILLKQWIIHILKIYWDINPIKFNGYLFSFKDHRTNSWTRNKTIAFSMWAYFHVKLYVLKFTSDIFHYYIILDGLMIWLST